MDEHAKKKRWLMIGGAIASLVALFYLMRKSGSGTPILAGSGGQGMAGTGSATNTGQEAQLLLQAEALKQKQATDAANLQLQTQALKYGFALEGAKLATQVQLAQISAQSSAARSAMSATAPALKAGLPYLGKGDAPGSGSKDTAPTNYTGPADTYAPGVSNPFYGQENAYGLLASLGSYTPGIDQNGDPYVTTAGYDPTLDSPLPSYSPVDMGGGSDPSMGGIESA